MEKIPDVGSCIRVRDFVCRYILYSAGTLSLCFLHNGTKLPPDGGSLRTDVRKGLLHKDISTDKILTLEAKLPASGFCGHKKRKPQRFSKKIKMREMGLEPTRRFQH
ncbi:hypothetical protein CLOL250_00818 [Clostridium sp. L2-50]|nr:hypothetical protein CLOL250_00818 [Clostridium sp. L2-50]